MNIPNLPFRRDDLHILAVDDEAVQLHAVTKALKNLGYHVSNASNGREALEVLKSGNTFDLILSDVVMPIMNGPEFLMQTRADPRFAQIPIIMMSSNDQYEIVFDCLSKGADDYVIKPLSPQVLKNMYASVWLKRKQNAAAAKVLHQNIEKEAIQKRIDEMKKNFNQSFKTPLNDITKQLESVLKSSGISQEALNTITGAINTLKTIDQEGGPVTTTITRPAVVRDYAKAPVAVGGPMNPIKPVAIRPFVSNRVVADGLPDFAKLDLEDQLLAIDFKKCNSIQDLISLANMLFSEVNLQKRIKVTEDTEIKHFLKRTRASFHAVPFHNFKRAIDGLQLATIVLSKYQDKFTNSELVAGLFAAFIHDIDHPGTNNLFQIKTLSKYALTYNNKSVLEMNSASVGSIIINEVFSFCNPSKDRNKKTEEPQPQSDDQFEDIDITTFRNTFLECVLSTDYMKLDKTILKITEIVKRGDSEDKWKDPEYRLAALKILTLMADLSFSIRDWANVTRHWYQFRQDENYQQGDTERRHNFNDIDPLFDRKANNSLTKIIQDHFDNVVKKVFTLGVLMFDELQVLISERLILAEKGIAVSREEELTLQQQQQQAPAEQQQQPAEQPPQPQQVEPQPVAAAPAPARPVVRPVAAVPVKRIAAPAARPRPQ